MKDLIVIAIVATFACGLAKEVEKPSPGLHPWWPTQPPWWPSDWPQWPTTTKPPPTSTCINYWKYPEPTDCSKYLLCLSGTLFPLDCPATLHFHDAIQDCNLPGAAECEVTTTSGSPVTEPTTTTTTTEEEAAACEDYKKYPYPTDCSKYYKCLGGELFVMDCPVTLHYHDAIQNCDRPEVAECQVTTDAPPPTTTTTTDEPTTTTTTTTTARPPTTTTTAEPEVTTPPTTTTKRPNPGGVNCNAGMYHPHPTDCTKFYQCSNGTPYLMPCPAGLHWNTAIDTCDWPAAAGCTAGH